MRVSGFTFVRNGNELGYPFVESIRSALPLCDEMIVNVPRSTDGTLDSIRAIGDPKIRVIESDWPEKGPLGDAVFKRNTDLALEQCAGDWCVYIQADEVLHEETIPSMRASMERNLDDRRVEALLVDFTHLYGSFFTETYAFGWYYKEIRIVRRDPGIRAWGGAQGFRTTDGRKLRVRHSGGHYIHYGHAIDPKVARRKRLNFARLYGNEEMIRHAESQPESFYRDDEKVRPFRGTHPAVMRDLVAAANWTYASRDPLVRFRGKYFWADLALILKRFTGITLGVPRNYRLLR